VNHSTAQAFHPPSLLKSGGQPSDDGLHELAASRRHGLPVTWQPVVSYTTFSPLPVLLSTAVIFFCLILPSPTASIFRSGASYAARTFLLRYIVASDRPEHCIL